MPGNGIQDTHTGDAAAFFKLVSHPVKFRLFLLSRLPSAYFAGTRVRSISESRSEVTIPYKWFSRNPFRSTYFACLAMAAEMSTGVLALAHLYKLHPPVSMLVVGLEGKFFKKATGVTRFICEDGNEIRGKIAAAIDTQEGQSIRAHSTGYNQEGEIVAEFYITWSFKQKTVRKP